MQLLSLVEIILPCLAEDIFTIKKVYTISVVADEPFGKWPNSMGNSFFLESAWLLDDFVDMLVDKAQSVL